MFIMKKVSLLFCFLLVAISNIVASEEFDDISVMEEVGKSIIRIVQQPTNDYSASTFTLNTDSIAKLLGCGVGDMSFQAIDNKGKLSTQSTGSNGGYWMTRDGIICTWGDNAYFFVEPAALNDFSLFYVGQMPKKTSIGEEGHTLMYLTSGSNYYQLDITIVIGEDKDDYIAFESVAVFNDTVQAIDNTYAWSYVAQSVSIPFAQIYEFIGTIEPTLYALNIESISETTGQKYTKEYSLSEKPGFWLTEDGKRTTWGSAPWGITGLNSTADNFIIQCFQMEGYGVVGDVFNGQFFLVNEETGKMITINLTYQIVDQIIPEVVGEEWIYLPVSFDDLSVDYDLTKVAAAFGLENVSDLFEGYYVKGLKADGTYTAGADAINTGITFTTAGAADEYGDLGVGFSEDGTQIWTYSNVDIEAPFKIDATMCFEIEGQQYIIHFILVDSESYSKCNNSAQLMTGDTFTYIDADGTMRTYTVVGKNLIENPSFDNNTTGWTGGDGNPIGGYELKTGGVVDGGIYLCPGNGGKGGNASIGTTWNIEIGKTYVFSFFLKNESDTNAQNPAGDGYIKVSTSNKAREETLVLQPLPHVDAGFAWTQNTWVFTAEHTTLSLCARWLNSSYGFDSFILAEVVENHVTKELEDILAECDSWIETFGSAAVGYSEFTSVVADGYNVLDTFDRYKPEEINSILEKLAAQLLNFRVANASTLYPVDFTDYLKNSKFDDGLSFWNPVNTAHYRGVNIRNFAYFEEIANPVCEINGTPSTETSISQTIYGLPLGCYRFIVECVMNHSVSVSSPNEKSGASISLNGKILEMITDEITEEGAPFVNSYPHKFCVESIVVRDSCANIKFAVSPNANFTYVAIDNLGLEYLGSLNTYKDSIKSWMGENSDYMLSVVRDSLDFALLATDDTQKDVIDVYISLDSTFNKAQYSVAQVKYLWDKYNEAADMLELEYLGHEELCSVLGEVEVLFEDFEWRNTQDVVRMAERLEQAINDYIDSKDGISGDAGTEFVLDGISYRITSTEEKTLEIIGIAEDFLGGDVVIPDSILCNGSGYHVTSIRYMAFMQCDSLISIVLPNGLTSIGILAFWECTNLTSITIPNSVFSIDIGAFMETAWYNNLPDGAIYINDMLYEYKGAMPENTEFILKEGTKSISMGAFSACGSCLASVTIPESVSWIGAGAFSACDSLKEVWCYAPTPPTLLNHVLNYDVFDGCTSLSAIYVPATSVELYQAAEGWRDFTILPIKGSGKVIPTIDYFSLRYEDDIVYDGLPHAVEVIPASGISNYTVNYIGTKGVMSIVPPIEVGEYSVSIHVDESDLFYSTTLDSVALFRIGRMDDVEWNALQELYEATGGRDYWYTKWDIEDGITAASTFKGVVYKEGHVVELNLVDNNLVGELPISVLTMPYLEGLYVSNNSLTGDIGKAIQTYMILNEQEGSIRNLDISYNNITGNIGTITKCCPNLEYLYARGNHLTDVYPILPETMSVSLTEQTIDMPFVWDGMLSYEANIGGLVNMFPTLLFYNHTGQGYTTPVWRLESRDSYSAWTVKMRVDASNYTVRIETDGSNRVYYGESGDTLDVTTLSPTVSSSSKAKIVYMFEEGDADFSSEVDVMDLQTIINYIFKEYQYYPFNHTAANIQSKDSRIDVLDVIAFVDLLMSDTLSTDSSLALARMHRAIDVDAEAYLYWEGNRLILETEKDIAALDIVLQGNEALLWNNALGMTTACSSNENCQRVIGYSMSGNYIPQGKHVLLTAAEPCGVVTVLMADRAAQKVEVALKASENTLIETDVPARLQCRSSDGWLQLCIEGAWKQLQWKVYTADGERLGQGVLPYAETGVTNLCHVGTKSPVIIVVRDESGVILTQKINTNK